SALAREAERGREIPRRPRVIALLSGYADKPNVGLADVLLEICLSGPRTNPLKLSPTLRIALQEPGEGDNRLDGELELSIAYGLCQLERRGGPRQRAIDILGVEAQVCQLSMDPAQLALIIGALKDPQRLLCGNVRLGQSAGAPEYGRQQQKRRCLAPDIAEFSLEGERLVCRRGR